MWPNKGNWMKKSQTCQFGSAKWLWPNIFQRHSYAAIDWLDSLIGLGGLLLVVFH
jgi:hypothetical protein